MPPEDTTPPPPTTEIISVEEAIRLAELDVKASGGDEPAEEPEPKPKAKTEKKEPARGDDGKFKAADGEEPEPEKEPKEAAPKKEPAEKAEKEEPAEAPTGGLNAARRLWKDGKVEEAVKLAFGIETEELKLTSKQWSEVNHKLRTAKAAAQEKENAATQKLAQAQQLITQFIPMAQARIAYQNGDYDKAFELAFSEKPNDFQRKLIAQVAGGGSDPKAEARIAALERAFTEREQQLQHREHAIQQAEQQRQAQEQVKAHLANVSRELQESGDDRFERVATRQDFLDAVLAIQRKHWDEDTHATLPPLEAAELAWEEKYGDILTERQPERGRQSRVSPERGGVSPRRPPAKAGTNLRHSQAAEAAPEEELTGDELMQHYIRKAEAQKASEKSQH